MIYQSESDRPMQYKITHTTRYDYTEAVSICHNQVRLTPRDTLYQNCDFHRLEIKPTAERDGRRNDYFGNRVDAFSIHKPHSSLTVTATSRVTVQPVPILPEASTPPWELVAKKLREQTTPDLLDAYQFAFDSPLVARAQTLAEYAQASFSPGSPVLQATRELTRRIHRDFVYDSQATTVNTPLKQVFQQRRGVCQDFAHVQIGCLRSLGLAARYISGYLRTQPPPGKARLVGADASHAWVSVYCGEVGWIDLDPTNNVLANTDHVCLAWGRDYADVAPIQGVFVGGGSHRMTVSVDVLPIG